MKPKTRTPKEDPPGKAFHELTNQILQLANQGIMRADFQREVSERVLRFFDCDSIELWLKDHEKYYPSIARKISHRPFEIEFKTCLPCDTVETDPDPHPEQGISKADGPRPRLFLTLKVDRKETGYLRLSRRRPEAFIEKERTDFLVLSRVLGIASIHRHVQVELRERVKELTCLYGIAHLGAQPGLSIEEVLQGIVDLLPPAWLYPEITSARITLGGQSYSTPYFQEGIHQLKAEIVVQGEAQGTIEVAYREARPELDEGPFMKEERSLIDAVSKEVAIILKRRRDEEDKLKLEEQLRHADRLATIGQLAAGVAHELNEPLGSILGFSQLAQKCAGLPPQARQDVDRIVSASLYAREIVKKLLIFARQMPPQKSKVSLNHVIREGLSFLQSSCVEGRVNLSLSLSPDLREVCADPSQIHQVIINLVVNALQAMPEGGQLSIKTVNLGKEVALHLADTGTGMSPEVLRKIFIPFFTTKDVGQGTGLGLPVVHGIVTSHGGSIRVESGVGEGTRFEIRLPAIGMQQIKEKSTDASSD